MCSACGWGRQESGHRQGGGSASGVVGVECDGVNGGSVWLRAQLLHHAGVLLVAHLKHMRHRCNAFIRIVIIIIIIIITRTSFAASASKPSPRFKGEGSVMLPLPLMANRFL